MVEFDGMKFDSIWMDRNDGETFIYIGDEGAPNCYTMIKIDEKELRQLGNQIKNYFDGVSAK
jgi:hypothetical protein